MLRRHLADRRNAALATTAVVVASIIAGWLVFEKLVLLHRLPKWDEAYHILQGTLIAHDLREGNLFAFLYDTYHQIYWPPMHSLLVGGAFLVAGDNLETARAVSVLSFVALAPTLYFVGRTVEPRHGVLAGCLAAALALTSPGLIELAAESMLEMPGLLALSLGILVYCALERNPDAPPRAHALLGICAIFIYLVKTHLAVLLVISVALAKLITVGYRPRRLLTRRNFYAVLPLVVFCAVWFAYPPRVLTTWDALVNQPWGGEEGRGLRGLLFYPRAIFLLSGWTSVLLLGGVVLGWKARGEPALRFLTVMALTLFLISEIHHTKLERHIVPIFPPIFVLTGVAGARLWPWLLARGRSVCVAALAVLAFVAAFQTWTVLRIDRSETADPEDFDSLKYVSEQARDQAPALVIRALDASPAPPVLDWNLVNDGVLPVTAANTAVDAPVERRLAGAIDRFPIPSGLRSIAKDAFDRYYAPVRVRSLHSRRDRSLFEVGFEAILERDPPSAIIAAISTSDTTQQVDFVDPVIVGAGFQRVSVREFPSKETRVVIYRRP